MGMPGCACIPPDGDDWTKPWLRECDHHKRLRELLLRVAVLDAEPGPVDLPDDLAAEIVDAVGGFDAVAKAAVGDA